MSNKKLQLTYRPSTFSEIIGQDGIVKILRKSVLDVSNKMEQAAIFHGPFGSGKTTTARIVARSMLCLNRKDNGDPCNKCDSCIMFLSGSHPGYTEIDGAKITKKEDFEKILEGTNYQAVGSRYNVILVDECHMMSKAAQNLLLKPLEEGKPGVYWFFCTTEYDKIIDTIRSRCVDYRIRPIPYIAIAKRVMDICDIEGIKYENQAIEDLVTAKKGHFRDVLVFIGKVRDLGTLSVDVIYDYLDIGVNDSYFEILKLIQTEPDKALSLLDKALLRVSAIDIYNGIAQAAMDAYKVGQGLRPALLIANKDLPKQIYDTYGSLTTTIAQYLIDKGSRRVDNNYLISTILILRDSIIAGDIDSKSPVKVVIKEVVRETTNTTSIPSKTINTPQNITTNESKVTRPVLTSLDDKARRKPKKDEIAPIAVDLNQQQNRILSDNEFGLLLQRGHR